MPRNCFEGGSYTSGNINYQCKGLTAQGNSIMTNYNHFGNLYCKPLLGKFAPLIYLSQPATQNSSPMYLFYVRKDYTVADRRKDAVYIAECMMYAWVFERLRMFYYRYGCDYMPISGLGRDCDTPNDCNEDVSVLFRAVDKIFKLHLHVYIYEDNISGSTHINHGY